MVTLKFVSLKVYFNRLYDEFYILFYIHDEVYNPKSVFLENKPNKFVFVIQFRPVTILQNDTERHRDEGFVQRLVVRLTRDLRPAEYVYITIWAINEVIY